MAAKLLRTTGKTVIEVSEACGFSSPGYFGRVFKETFSTTPKAYQWHLHNQGTVLRSLRSENRPLIALYFFHLETGLFYMKSFHLRIHSGRTQLFLDPEKLIVLCDALASAGSTGLDLTGI